jgi:putative ABC transport system permease protein
VRAVPGVRAAAVAWGPPFWGTGSDGYRIEGHQSAAAGGDEPQTITAAVSPGFFATLEMPLRRGRDFGTMDRDSTLPVAIVDETLAHRFWTDGDAVGHRIQMTGDTTWLTIVGVVGAIRDVNPADPPMPHTYFPYTQQPGLFVNLEVRTAGDPKPTLRAVLRTIATLEPEIPLDYSQPLTATIGNTLADRRLTELLLGGFAVLALLLAAIGIYGVMSLFVSHRTREFGIRLAIGAQPGSIVRLVLREGLLLALIGVGVGVSGAFLLTRWMRQLLYDVSATDPTVFAMFPIILVVVAVMACYAPSRRAAKSDPLAAIRAD